MKRPVAKISNHSRRLATFASDVIDALLRVQSKRTLRVISTSEACLVPKIDDHKLNNFTLHLDESALMDPLTIYSESVDK